MVDNNILSSCNSINKAFAEILWSLWGSGGRGFKSRRSDINESIEIQELQAFQSVCFFWQILIN